MLFLLFLIAVQMRERERERRESSSALLLFGTTMDPYVDLLSDENTDAI